MSDLGQKWVTLTLDKAKCTKSDLKNPFICPIWCQFYLLWTKFHIPGRRHNLCVLLKLKLCTYKGDNFLKLIDYEWSFVKLGYVPLLIKPLFRKKNIFRYRGNDPPAVFPGYNFKKWQSWIFSVKKNEKYIFN